MSDNPARDLGELDVLALTLHHEAGGESLLGQMAVACVIRNRAVWGKWGPTLRDVCLANKQFSCWQPIGGADNYLSLVGHADALRAGKRPDVMRRAYQVAHSILGDAPDVTNHATHYYAPAAMVPPGRLPVWAKGRTPSAHIGGHVFFNLRPAETIQ